MNQLISDTKMLVTCFSREKHKNSLKFFGFISSYCFQFIFSSREKNFHYRIALNVCSKYGFDMAKARNKKCRFVIL